MLPTSTKVPDRFTPDGAEVTYLIQIPDAVSKARYRRAVTAAGVRIWPKWAMVESARATIDAAAPENAEDLLAICERYAALDEAAAAEDEVRATVTAWGALSRVLQAAGGDFAALVADNEFWWELAPRFAARCFLLGTDSVALKRGADGMVPDATLDGAVPEEHIRAIGWRAMALFSPSEAEAKNSASPQPSPSGPATSTAASGLQTDPAGSSSASSTSETRS